MNNSPSWLYFILIAFSIALWSCQTKQSGRYTVSIPTEKLTAHLQDGKRITEYKIKLTTARVYGVTKIANDWWLKIKPEREDNQIEASAGHGASWLTIEDVSKGAFDKFMIIEKDKNNEKLKITADIFIDIPMEETEKHIRIEEKDMIITAHQ